MRINTNTSALTAQGNLNRVQTQMSKNLQRLSTGLRINSAKDDAAGLAIAEKMNTNIRALKQASKNAQDASTLLNQAESGVEKVTSILQRMGELASSANSSALETDERSKIAQEMTALRDEIDSVAKTTSYNGKTLLNGGFGVSMNTTTTTLETATGIVSIDVSKAVAGTTYTVTSTGATTMTITDGTNTQTISGLAAPAAGTTNTIDFDLFGISVTVNKDVVFGGAAGTTFVGGAVVATEGGSASFQVGADAALGESYLTLTAMNVSTAATGLDLGNAKIAVDNVDHAKDTIANIKSALNKVSTARSAIGATQSRIEFVVDNVETQAENLQGARSRIMDVDMASEMADFTKNQILSQAGTAMLAQANQIPQGILKLLG